MNPGLHGNDLPLDARQHQLCSAKVRPKSAMSMRAIGPADLHDIRAPPLAFGPDFHQPQNPSHASTLGQRTDAHIPDRRHTPNLATVPRYKHLIGPKLRARSRPAQLGETALAIQVLNRMIRDAKPVSVRC